MLIPTFCDYGVYFAYTVTQPFQANVVIIVDKGATDNTLSKFLKETAKERRLSLRQFADVVGISHAYVNKLMTGIDPRSNKPISPTIDVLFKIADALEVPRIEFLRQCGYLDAQK